MHPYKSLKHYQYWNKTFSKFEYEEQQFIVNPGFKITTNNKIATAGSCFAQHIGRYLRKKGINIVYGETPPNFLSEDNPEYEKYFMYSAMYGNIYTIHQFSDLIEQAFNLKPIINDFFISDITSCDLLRPSIINGEYSNKDLEELRIHHLKSVFNVFSNIDVLLYTYGLTEGWVNSNDGYAYPVCPGTVGGKYLPEQHHFKNYDYSEIYNTSYNIFKYLKEINPNLRIIVTVSPVALAATYNDRHVAVSTCNSKSILRAVVSGLVSKLDFVEYFPSYDILTSPASLGRYFKRDLREVNENGVAMAMKFFLDNYTVGNETNNLSYESKDPECDEIFYGVTRT
jgi:GSCFA family